MSVHFEAASGVPMMGCSYEETSSEPSSDDPLQLAKHWVNVQVEVAKGVHLRRSCEACY